MGTKPASGTTTATTPMSSLLDVRQLDAGDMVEIYIEDERRWTTATFEITTAGAAVIVPRHGPTIRFDRAIAMGLRRPARR